MQFVTSERVLNSHWTQQVRCSSFRRQCTASSFQITILTLLNTAVVCECDLNEIYSSSDYQLFLLLCCHFLRFLSSTQPVSEGKKEIFTKSLFHLPAPSYCNVKKHSLQCMCPCKYLGLPYFFMFDCTGPHTSLPLSLYCHLSFYFSYNADSCTVLLVP